MYSAQYCIDANNTQLAPLLYRPLYWYGNNNSPAVDFAQSIGTPPIVSNHGHTFTIRLKHYRWSDGEPVTAYDLVFWMNMLEASPATEWCFTAGGLFPYNVQSYRAVNGSTFQITMRTAYNPTWMLYNELFQLTPIPLAWDRLSLTAPIPHRFAGSVGSTVHGAGRIYTFLNKQSQDTGAWGSSPLWRVVDGPFRVTGMTTSGQVTMVANHAYSGSPKPSIAKFVELPFTSTLSLFNEIRSGGPNAVTIASLPQEDAPLTSTVAAEGYDVNRASAYEIDFMALNLNNPTVGPIFRQLYFRQAFQHLVDQRGWIHAILRGTALPTYGPVPPAPGSPLVSAEPGGNPYPFSTRAAARLLTANGWRVVPRGASECVRPGTQHGECGAGIAKDEKIAFTLNYASGLEAVKSEMADLQSKLRSVGIAMTLVSHDVGEVVASEVHCTPAQSACDWEAANNAGGWTYGNFVPSGEQLFLSTSETDFSNYANKHMNALIQRVLTAPTRQFRRAITALELYTKKQVPVVFLPTSIGTFSPGAGTLVSKRLGGYVANAVGFPTPEDWYLTK